MKSKTHVLQLAPMGRLLKKAGADRISETAKKALREILEQEGIKLSRKAIMFANHAGRTTIKGEDVSLAFKE